MAFDFPSSPAVGQEFAPAGGPTYVWNGVAWTLKSVAIGGASVTISDTAPAAPTNGTMWWESDTGKLWISYSDGTSTQWVNSGQGAPIASTSVPPSQRTVLTSGSGTYTTPSGTVVWLEVEMVGGGGGGAAGANANPGQAGTATTFGPLMANGGGGGNPGTGWGLGGTASGGDLNIQGGGGGGGVPSNAAVSGTGGVGGASFFGGGGPSAYTSAGGAGTAPGSGGGGGGTTTTAQTYSGGGGGAGGYCRKLFVSPAATYAYAVGTGGNGGAAGGANGAAGGNGAPGIIIVTAHFGS